MKKFFVALLVSVFLVGCASSQTEQDLMNEGGADVETEDVESGDEIVFYEGEYTLSEPLASRGDNEMCLMITQMSAGLLPAEFYTPDDGEFAAICLNDEDKDKVGLRETFDNLGDCKYSEVGNRYTITNLRIDPSQEYEKRADLVSSQRFMGGSTSCE